MILDTVANWRKLAAWAKQEVKQYIALRAVHKCRLALRQFEYLGNSSPHTNIAVYAYKIDPNGANAVDQACRHVWGRFRQTARVTLEYYIPQNNRWYTGHQMTILAGKANEQNNVLVDSLVDLAALGSGFEADRLDLSEKYASDLKVNKHSVYEQVEHIRFCVYLPTTNTAVGVKRT